MKLPRMMNSFERGHLSADKSPPFSRRARFAIAGSDLLTDVAAFEACAKLRSGGGSSSALNTFCDEVREFACSIKLAPC
jgi:hypothetical protein